MTWSPLFLVGESWPSVGSHSGKVLGFSHCGHLILGFSLVSETL